MLSPTSIARNASNPSRPEAENFEQDTPEVAPELPTQTQPRAAEAASVVGKSPWVEAGGPRRVRWVGLEGEMAKRETVEEPALTAKRY